MKRLRWSEEARWISAFAFSSVIALAASGCSQSKPDDPAAPEPAYAQHEEQSDFDPVADDQGKADSVSPSAFDRNNIMSESYFVGASKVNADQVQRFLEQPPYAERCFLADVQVDGTSAAETIVKKAEELGLNPVVLLVRMQVEKSLISKSARPAQRALDYAFGCGCFDGSSCAEEFKGFGTQLHCAADALVQLHNESVDGSAEWRVGRTGKSLDGYFVRPGNHATAAFYGYTPWVLPNHGGNWLVWNVTRKFALHFAQLAETP
jgi:hypothetical protein